MDNQTPITTVLQPVSSNATDNTQSSSSSSSATSVKNDTVVVASFTNGNNDTTATATTNTNKASTTNIPALKLPAKPNSTTTGTKSNTTTNAKPTTSTNSSSSSTNRSTSSTALKTSTSTINTSVNTSSSGRTGSHTNKTITTTATATATASKSNNVDTNNKSSNNNNNKMNTVSMATNRSQTNKATTARSDDADTANGLSKPMGDNARQAGMDAAAKAIAKLKAAHDNTLSLRTHPHLVMKEFEAIRFKHNGDVQSNIAFQQKVEKRRLRIEGLAGSKAELFRLQQIHSAQREDTRREILRQAVHNELDLLGKLKDMKIKSVAGLADALNHYKK